MTVATVPITKVIKDPRCQSRTGIDLALVQEYVDAIEDRAALPPVSTIRTPEGHYLYDGFHRAEAYRRKGVTEIAVNYEDGDIWDAIERSCAVNATHGKRRTNEDKRRAVETMLTVMQHKGERWSNREVARRCGVHHNLVAAVLGESSGGDSQIDAPRTVSRNGSTYEMNTSNIGKVRAPNLATVDRDTGEIVDDDVPEPEYVDPRDPASFVWEAPPKPQAPSADWVVEGPFDPKAEAQKLMRRFGPGGAREIADAIYDLD